MDNICSNVQFKENETPFFSIVIPTRNRAELVLDAIQSVLNQSFTNYELIISDNSDVPLVPESNNRKIPCWLRHSHVKYVYTKKAMYLADHFDFATRLAKGRYIAILTDRFVMLPSALEVLFKVISAYQSGEPDLIVWNTQSNYSEITRIQTTAEFTGRIELFEAKKLLANFIEFSSWYDGNLYFSKLPRGLNSIYKRRLADELITEYGQVFRPFSPDYASAFLFVAYADEVLYIDLPLYISHGNKSTGNTSNLFGLQTFATEVDPIENCPLKIGTVFNTLVRDFLATKKLVHPRLQNFEISIVGYYLSNYAEFINKESIGSLIDLKPFYKVWLQGLEALPAKEQNEIREGMKQLAKRRPSRFNIVKQRMLRHLRLDKFRDYIRAFQSSYEHRKKGNILYRNIAEATAETDRLISMKFQLK